MPGRRLGIQTHMGMAVARPAASLIDISSPAAGAGVSGLVILKGTIATAGTVEVNVDGGAYRTANRNGANWTSTWDMNTLSAGSHLFGARCGGASTSRSFTVSTIATVPGLQLDRWSNFSTPTNKDKYAVVNTTVSDMTTDPVLPGRLGLYRDMKAVPPGGGSDFGIPTSEAVANGWLCHLQSNPATVYTMGDGNWMINPGLTAVRQRWVSYTLATYFTPRPWINSIIIDNCNPRTNYKSAGDPDFYPNEYPNYAAWRAALLGMFQYCCDALKDAGLYVLCNMTGLIEEMPGGPGGNEYSQATRDWWTDVAPHIHAGNIEDPMVASNNNLLRVSGSAPFPAEWATVRAFHPFANGLGLDFHNSGIYGKKGGSSTANGDGVLYQRVCWLLDWNGRSGGVKNQQFDNSGDPWTDTPTWVQNAGQPTGDAVQELTDVWTRGFTGGAISKIYANTRQYGGADVVIDGHTLTCPSALIV